MQWIERRHRHLPLDTLRAVAVVLVFLQHTVPGGIPFGRSGVDLFFVLSGYLITDGLLRAPLEKGYFSNFYLRRSLRILPAYYLTIVLALLVVPTTVLGLVPWSVVYLANVGYAFDGNNTSSIAHLWSLSVEEQFYLLWPLALWYVRSPAARWRLVAALVLLGPVLRIALTQAWNWQSAYALLPARMDGLAIGAGLALLQQAKGREWFAEQRAPLLGGAVVTGLLFVGASSLWPFTHRLHMTAVLSLSVALYGFVVAATLGLRDTWTARAMSLGPVVYLGQISYGLYLIHRWVVDAVEQRANGTLEVLAATGVITLVLAMLSYHLFEKPIIDQRRRFAPAGTSPLNPGPAQDPVLRQP